MSQLTPCFALPAPLSNPVATPRRRTVCSPRRAARPHLRTRVMRAAADSPADPEREASVAPPAPPPTPPTPPTPPAAASAAASAATTDDDSDILAKVPGKYELSEPELLKQKKVLEEYSEELRRARLLKEREDARLFGWVKYAETLNGRLAMFFFVTGLLTEYWTGYTIPEQIELMLRTLGVI